MQALLTLRSRFVLFLLTAFVAFLGARADAQTTLWDHYKVYDTNPKPPGTTTVILRDQFMLSNHNVRFLDKFMNPVRKIHLDDGAVFPINDDLLHYTWWSITPVPFGATVRVFNQFGQNSLRVFEAQYLLNPATKNDPTPQLPVKNHYKCYRCDGQPVHRPLRLVDQFDTWDVNDLFPKYYCNPVEKTVPGTQPHPIIDPAQHYVCYEFQPIDPNLFTAFIQDQFIGSNFELRPGHMLCVPTEKLEVVSAEAGTWGKLKMLYR